jgi:hypothetical protein
MSPRESNSSESVKKSQGKLYHIDLAPGELANSMEMENSTLVILGDHGCLEDGTSETILCAPNAGSRTFVI